MKTQAKLTEQQIAQRKAKELKALKKIGARYILDDAFDKYIPKYNDDANVE